MGLLDQWQQQPGLMGGLLGGQFDADPQNNTAAKNALLHFGLSLLSSRGGSFGQNVGAAGLQSLDAYGASQQQQRQQKMQDLALSRAQRDDQHQRALEDLRKQFIRPGVKPDSMDNRDVGAPGEAAVPATSFDKPGWMAARMGLDPEGTMKLLPQTESQYSKVKPGDFTQESMDAFDRTGKHSLLRPAVKVARTVERMGANGQPEIIQMDERGNPVGAPMPKPVEMKFESTGGGIAPMNPYSGAVGGPVTPRTYSPDALLSAGTARRGQDMTDARAGQSNALQQEAQRTQIVTDPNMGVLAVDKGASTYRPVTGASGPIPGENKVAATKLAGQLRSGIDMARTLIPQATASGVGAAVDTVAGWAGKATPGADAAGQLETLAGWMTSNVPRMQGPQSDKDTLLYRQMAAQVGDRTKPASVRLKALDTLEALQTKYADINGVVMPGAGGAGAGAGAGAPRAPAAPRPGTVQGGYLFKGGNPADPASWVRQ